MSVTAGSGDRTSGVEWRGWEDGMPAAEHILELLGGWWDSKPLVCHCWEMSWLGGGCVWTSRVSWAVNAVESWVCCFLVWVFFSEM